MARILIIEDDESIAAIERDYLEINGFEADIAEDGKTGLTKGCTGSYDLILLDLMLPVIDGFEVCRKLREKINIPILMVTARREDIDKIRRTRSRCGTIILRSRFLQVFWLPG